MIAKLNAGPSGRCSNTWHHDGRCPCLILRVEWDPGLTSPNRRLHYMARARLNRQARNATLVAWAAAGHPTLSTPEVDVVLLCRRGRRMDPDNLIAGAKPVIDQLFPRDRRARAVQRDDAHLRFRDVLQVTGRAHRDNPVLEVHLCPTAR